jgi:predicted porin
MKKIQLTGLALATLAACAPAWAQSTVTIYGAVDTAVGKFYQADSTQIKEYKTSLQSSSRVNLQDSFVGFKGVEELGGGLQVGFQLEQKLDASSGSADPEGAFARSSNVWLGGGWGRITLGRAITPSYNTMAGWDLMGAGNNSIALRTFGAVGTGGQRQSNQISYRTPQLGGLIVEAAYTPKENSRSKIDLGATYVAGPLTMGVAYNKFSDLDANYAFGAKYNYQNFEFSGGYYHSRNGISYSPTTLQVVPNAVFGSDGITLGGKATWGQFSAGVDVARETKAESVVGNVRFDEKKYTNVLINGTYAFSKRTKTYVNYMRAGGFNNYGVGLSHSF